MDILDACNAIRLALAEIEPLHESATAHGWTVDVTVTSELVDYQPSNEYSGRVFTSYVLVADNDALDVCFVARGAHSLSVCGQLVKQGCTAAMARALAGYVSRMLTQQKARLITHGVGEYESVLRTAQKRQRDNAENDKRNDLERVRRALARDVKEYKRVHIPSAWDSLKD